MEFIITLFIFFSGLSFVVIYFGGKREIGSRKTFWITLFLSPIVGLIAVLLSKRKGENNFDYYGELLKITELKERKAISESEFETEKLRIDNSRAENEKRPKSDYAGMYYYLIFFALASGLIALVVIGGGSEKAPVVYKLF
jgi:hypothetical protein